MKLAILILIGENDKYMQTRICIENLMRYVNELEVELFISVKSKNESLLEFLKNIKPKTLICDSFLNKKSELYNELLQHVLISENNFICVFPINTIVHDSWAIELIATNKNVARSGISSIRTTESDVQILPVLNTKEEFVNVWVSKANNVVNGVILFKKELLDVVGFFDKQLSEYEINEFAFRVAGKGFQNHYVMNQYSTKLNG